MSDLVGNPEDRFSRVEAQMIVHILIIPCTLDHVSHSAPSTFVFISVCGYTNTYTCLVCLLNSDNRKSIALNGCICSFRI